MSYYQQRNVGPLPPPALSSDKLRLYHVDMNPYGHRVLLILEAKKAKYEVYKLDPLSLPEWFRTKNPRLKIPVLEIPTEYGDKYLFESVVICDYLDEKYTRNQLHSRDPYVKAQDRLLIERFNELIKGSLECFDTNFAFGSEQIIQTLDIFEKELALRGTNYFAGNRPGMLDYMIWPWVERLYLLRCVNQRKFDEKRGLFPNFADWGDQMQLDDVVKKHAISPQEYFDYYKNARTHSMGENNLFCVKVSTRSISEGDCTCCCRFDPKRFHVNTCKPVVASSAAVADLQSRLVQSAASI